MTDAYDSIEKAELYDWEQGFWSHQNSDIKFYLEEAARWGGPILELACGTGRITLPLVRAGYRVTGLDSSAAMLAVLERKATAENLWVNSVQADMAGFDLGRKFRLILLAFNALLLLQTLDLQRACLQACRTHLAEGGAIIISIFPEPYWENNIFIETDDYSFDWTHIWEDRNLVVSRVSRQRRNRATRTTHWEGRLELIAPNGDLRTVEEQIVLRWDTRNELETLLRESGLHPIEWYGSYKRTPLDRDASRMIAICQASANDISETP